MARNARSSMAARMSCIRFAERFDDRLEATREGRVAFQAGQIRVCELHFHALGRKLSA